VPEKYVETKLYDEKLRLFLNTPHSGDSWDLWKYLELKKKKAVAGAKRMAGYRTGALRKNIRGYHLGNFTGQYVVIMADVPYALLHHQGTKPHIIRPNDTNGVLVFNGSRGRVVTTMVRHPGTRPNPYLSRQLLHFRG
jgi:hypothetical protein